MYVVKKYISVIAGVLSMFLLFKVDEERSKVVAVLREKQEIHEKLTDLERRHDKLQHDFSVKEAQNHALQVK